MVEVLIKYLKDIFDYDLCKLLCICVYRGGYLFIECCEIECVMCVGNIDGIVSILVLELGVDIGSLDVVIFNGYFGSVVVIWQCFGCVGCCQQFVLGVMVVSLQLLDQYVVWYLDFFVEVLFEYVCIVLDQLLILFDYICCVVFELLFWVGDGFGLIDLEVFLEVLVEIEVIYCEGECWEWIVDSYLVNVVSLCVVVDGNFVVVDCSDGCQQIIVEVDYFVVVFILYEGVIYMVQFMFYQVEMFDWEGCKVYVICMYVDYYIDSIDFIRFKVLDCFDGGVVGCGDLYYGEVYVVWCVVGYKKICYYIYENIGYGLVNLFDQELYIIVVWWQLLQVLLLCVFVSRQDVFDGFFGVVYVLYIVVIVVVMVDVCDLQKLVGNGDGFWFVIVDQSGCGQLCGSEGDFGVVELLQEFVFIVYLYDNFFGGVGFSELLW